MKYKCSHCFRRWMPAVWECNRVRQLYRNTLTTDFAQAFQHDHNNISDGVNEISPLVSHNIPSNSKKIS